MGVHTLTLISQWSMDGAPGDLNGGFRSPVDILEIVGGRTTQPPSSPIEQPPVHTESQLLVKRAGDDDWQPLLAALP